MENIFELKGKDPNGGFIFIYFNLKKIYLNQEKT